MNTRAVHPSLVADRSSQSEIRIPKSSIRNPQSAIRNVVAGGLMFAVAFTALALGTVEAWSVAIFELIILILLLLWTAKAIVDKRIEINFPDAAFPLAAFLLLALIQGIAFTGSHTSALSMDVEATRGAAVVIFFLFVSFLIASNSFSTLQQLRSLANFLIIFGLILAVFALIQHFTWEGRLFWFRPMTAAGAGLGGPFVNRNHFAGYMEMLIPLAVALALCRALRGEARAFYAFAAAIMGIAEVASLSRGGLVSLGAAMLFVAAISTRMKQRLVRGSRIEDRGARARDVTGQSSNLNPPSSIVYPLSSRLYPAFLVLLIAVAIGAGMYWVGADSGLAERLASVQGEPGATSRQTVWLDTLSMIRAHPVLGVGVGAYQTVFPMYGHSEGSTIVEFAHNDYLQALADGGIVGGALAIWFIIVIFRAFARGTASRDPVTNELALGAGAGIFAILVHSLFDFNLQLPSNALLFLVLAAIVGTTGAKSEELRAKG
jgi:O-antigen ligase